MSRIGKKPIPIPKDVEIDVKDDLLTVKGPNGQLQRKIHPGIRITTENDQLVVSVTDENKGSKAICYLSLCLSHKAIQGCQGAS